MSRRQACGSSLPGLSALYLSMFRAFVLVGLMFSATWPAYAETLTVVSFNLYNRPWNRAQRLLLAGRLLKDERPDIVALQESARYAGEARHATAHVAEALGFGYDHAWVDDGLVLSSGLGLVTRFAISDQRVAVFAENLLLEKKGFQTAIVATPAGALAVINVHLSSTTRSGIKDPQFEELAAAVALLRQRTPVLLLGDFNEPRESSRLKAFQQTVGASGVYEVGWRSVGSWNDYGDACDAAGAELIDHIFVIQGPAGTPPLRIVDGGVRVLVPPYASDHCPVVARIQLGDP